MYMNIELTSQEPSMLMLNNKRETCLYSIAEFIKENGSLNAVNEPLELLEKNAATELPPTHKNPTKRRSFHSQPIKLY